MSGHSESKPEEVLPAETYMIVNDADGNDNFEVEAVDDAAAANKALKELGWWVAKP